MKICCRENGNEVIYVQVSDLYHLDMMGKLPIYVKLKALSRPIISVKDNNKVTNYVSFDDRRLVSYFKGKEEIIDYNYVKNLSISQIEEMGRRLRSELENVMEMFLMTPSRDRNYLEQLKCGIDFLQLRFKEFEEIYLSMKYNSKLSLPLIMSEEVGFYNECEDFEVVRSLSPNQLLIRRKDGENISSGYEVPVDFIYDSANLAIEDDVQNGADFSEGSYVQFNLSDDSRYMVVDYGARKKSRLKPKESIFKRLTKFISSKGGKRLQKTINF